MQAAKIAAGAVRIYTLSKDRLAYDRQVNWLPHDADFLTAFGAVLAVCATSLGIVLGLGQFTAGARARRTIEWTSAALESEADEARKQILARLRLRAQGRLAAMHYVPLCRFTEALLFTLIAPIALVLAARDDSSSAVPAVLFGVVTLALVFRRAIRLYSERERVAHQFEAGGVDVEPVRVDIMEQMEGGTRREFALGTLSAVGVMTTGAFCAWGLVGGRDSVAWPGVAVALFACWGCLQAIGGYSRELAKNPPPHAVQP